MYTIRRWEIDWDTNKEVLSDPEEVTAKQIGAEIGGFGFYDIEEEVLKPAYISGDYGSFHISGIPLDAEIVQAIYQYRKQQDYMDAQEEQAWQKYLVA